jgi:pimeloyl-ACP methyl ester carboxylesterase
VSTFALIHGGGDVGWYWHLVEAELRQRGHDVVAPDLPCDDDTAGLNEYADTVVEAIGDRGDVVVVGQSLGGFTVPLVAARRPVQEMIFVAGMIPRPGEAPRDWWADTAYPGPSVEGDTYEMFLHDVPRELAEEALSKERDQSDARMGEVWPLEKWPDVPTRFILCTEDRFFPPDFLRGVVRDRLGIVPEEIAASHCVALSRPTDLADLLTAVRPG